MVEFSEFMQMPNIQSFLIKVNILSTHLYLYFNNLFIQFFLIVYNELMKRKGS